jgi:hypothetical protein
MHPIIIALLYLLPLVHCLDARSVKIAPTCPPVESMTVLVVVIPRLPSEMFKQDKSNLLICVLLVLHPCKDGVVRPRRQPHLVLFLVVLVQAALPLQLPRPLQRLLLLPFLVSTPSCSMRRGGIANLQRSHWSPRAAGNSRKHARAD